MFLFSFLFFFFLAFFFSSHARDLIGCNYWVQCSTPPYTHKHAHIHFSTVSALNQSWTHLNQRLDGEINQVAHNCGIVVHRFIANMQMNIIIQMNWSKDVCDNQRKQRAYTVHTLAHITTECSIATYIHFLFSQYSESKATISLCLLGQCSAIAIAFQCTGPIIGVAHSNGAYRKQ